MSNELTEGGTMPNHHMRATCPECSGVMDDRARRCRKCQTKSGDSRRGTGRGYYYSNGYKRVYVKNHPYSDRDGFVLEHRLIMEEYLKCYLPPTEFVHHNNEIRDDNRLENLSLCSNREHMNDYHAENEKYLELGRRRKC